MTKKNKIYDTSLVDEIKRKTDLYDTYFAAPISLNDYTNSLRYDGNVYIPDDYDVLDHTTNAFYDWNLKKNQTSKDTELGIYTRAEMDYQTLLGLRDYLNAEKERRNVVKALEQDPQNEELIQKYDAYTQIMHDNQDAYNNAFEEKFNTKSLQYDISYTLKKYIENGDERRLNALLERIDYEVNDNQDPINPYDDSSSDNLFKRKKTALENAYKYQEKIDEYQNKLDNSPGSKWYKAHSETPGMDIDDIDTYLYKLPGLMGSSAETIGSTIAAFVSGMVAYKTPNIALKGIAGAASVASNIYARSRESNAEIYSNYKQAVINESKRLKIYDDVVGEAKQKLASLGDTPEHINDDQYVYDRILNGDIEINNKRFVEAIGESAKGIRSLFSDNMALSAMDVAETAIQIVPIGVMAKKVRGLDRILKKAEKFRGLSGQLADKIDDVTQFGMHTLENLSTHRVKRSVLDLGGRVLLTGVMEGPVEEGFQYIRGHQMANGEYDEDPNIVKSWFKTIGYGARSVFAAVTPFDPVYSNDEEFLENVNGGFILGGLMTLGTGTVSAVQQARVTIPTDKFASALFAEKLNLEDRVRRNKMYAQAIQDDTFENLYASFDEYAERYKKEFEGVDLQAEKEYAAKFYNRYTSQMYTKSAEARGIKTNSDEYNTFASLLSHYEDLARDARDRLGEQSSTIEEFRTDPEIYTHVSDLVEKAVKAHPELENDAVTLKDGTRVSSTTNSLHEYLMDLVMLKSELEVNKRIRDMFANDAKQLDAIGKLYGIRTNKADVIKFRDMILSDITEIEKAYKKALNNLSQIGIKEPDLEVTTKHQELDDAYEALAFANLDYTRANQELKLMVTGKPEFIHSRIEEYNVTGKMSDDFIDRLNARVSGEEQRNAVIEGEEITPPTADEIFNQSEPEEEREYTIEEAVDAAMTEAEKRREQTAQQQQSQETGSQTHSQPDSGTFIDEESDSSVEEQNQPESLEIEPEDDAVERLNDIFCQELNNLNILSKRVHLGQLRILKNAVKKLNKKLPNGYSVQYRNGKYVIVDNDQFRLVSRQAYEEAKAEKARREAEGTSTQTNTVEEQKDSGQEIKEELDKQARQSTNNANAKCNNSENQPDSGDDTIDLTNIFMQIPNDGFSNLLNYHLTAYGGAKLRYHGMEQYLNNDEFAAVSAKPDFVQQTLKNGIHIEVKPYTNNQGQTEEAYYVIFKYDDKEYVAAIPTTEYGFRWNKAFNNLSPQKQQAILNNLRNLRKKIHDLNEIVKKHPNKRLQIVVTDIDATTGKYVNQKNPDGSAKNRKLNETRFLTEKDPYNLTPENVVINISMGARGSSTIENMQGTVALGGASLGQAMWQFKVRKPKGVGYNTVQCKLNYATFKDTPQVADYILKLLTQTDKYVKDAHGVSTPLDVDHLLNFIVNYSGFSAVNREDGRLQQDQYQALEKKQFYRTSASEVVIGSQIYRIADLISNTDLREQVKQYIIDNFHWNIPMEALAKNYFANDSRVKVLKQFFENNSTEKLVFIPGVLEFDQEMFGIATDANGNKVKSTTHPKGMSIVGWYVDKGILLTDIADDFTDANIYVHGVTLADENGNTLTSQATNAPTFNNKPNGPNLALEAIPEISEEDKAANRTANEWLASVLGVSPEISQSVVDTTEAGLFVVGRATKDSILLYKNAPRGTAYHEAWHRVTQLCIDEKSRQKLYKRVKGDNKSMTDIQADEILAEQFREFMLVDAQDYDFFTKNIFRRVYQFIKLWANLGSYRLASLYSQINRAKFKGIKPSVENVARFKALYGDKGPNFELNGHQFKHIATYHQFNQITKGLTYQFFDANFIKAAYIDFQEFVEKKPDFERLKLRLQAEASKNPSDALTEVIENFDQVFAPAVAARLKQFGISAHIGDEVADREEGAESANVGQHTVEGINISIKDNARAAVKFFFSTIPDYVFSEGVVDVRRDSITGFAQFVDTNRAWANVLKDLHGCRTLDAIKAKMHTYANNGSLFYMALLDRFNELEKAANQKEDVDRAADAEAMLTQIENTLACDINNFKTVKVSRDPQTKATYFAFIDNTVDVKSMVYPGAWSQSLFTYSNIFTYDQNGNVIAKPGAKERLDDWLENWDELINAFLKKNGVYTKTSIRYDENGNEVFDVTEYDFKDPKFTKAAVATLIKLLNNVGIGIDKATIDAILSQNLGTDIYYEQLRSFILATNQYANKDNYGGLRVIRNTIQNIRNQLKENEPIITIKAGDKQAKPTKIWNNVGIIKKLSAYYAASHATDNSLSSFGPDGNTYYMVSQNNFAKDRLNEIVTDDEVRSRLQQVVYNQHSLLLQRAQEIAENGELADIDIETFINFKDDTSGDIGRDYHGITPREDYLAKMTMIFNNRLIFPTIADKKTYHTIKGLMLPHDPLSITLKDGMDIATIGYSDEVLDIIIGYAEDELAQVELCLRQIDDSNPGNPDYLPPEKRIKNFHTPNYYETKENGETIKHKIEGNGCRFLFLTGIYGTDGKFKSFNDPTKSARQNLENAKAQFFNLSRQTQRKMISAVLNKRLREELDTAVKMGLVDYRGIPGNHFYTLQNKLLDQKILKERMSRYTYNQEACAIMDMLADYMINSIISIQEIEKCFSGAPAYYKVKYNEFGVVDSAVDKIKRLSGLTSTGVNNRLDFMNDPVREEYTCAELNDHEIRDRQFKDLQEWFYQANIKECVKELEGNETWEKVKDWSTEDIEKAYPEVVKAARKAARVEVAGYGKGVNVADAAVYISPTMARDLLRMRGVWNSKIKKAFDILMNPDTATKWDSDKRLYAEANSVVLNAMKYVAFGTRFEGGLGIPYFNKMALFPLFKSIATGDLKPLYDRMTASVQPIDAILFTSAVKAGSQAAISYYEKDGSIADLNRLVTYTQKFKYIRQQLETDPHTHEEQMAGTQFIKVNMSNIYADDLYGPDGDVKMSGAEVLNTVMNALENISDLGRQEIESQLYNKDGSLNYEALINMLYEDAIDSGANDNIMSALTTKDGKFSIPLAALSDNKWLESRFIAAVQKKTVDVDIPGGAFIQRSAFGIEATSAKVITENMINDGQPLLMVNDKDGSMDSIVSINLFKHIIPGYSKMTFREARQWLIDHKIIGQDAEATGIGYRIPTQSVASISALRFVDVLPEIMGDIVVLPESFTKLTGSDFDIDKLYIARYAFNERGGIIKHGDALKLEDVRHAYTNDIIRSYLKILTSTENQAMLKGSIDNATEAVKGILKDIDGEQNTLEQPIAVYTPTYQEDKKNEYTSGKAGIGPMALNNAHHVLTQLTHLRFASTDFTRAMQIEDVDRKYDLHSTTNKKNKPTRILDWLSAMINAFVDIAKDPYITKLNVNAWTYNMTTFLLRTGHGEDTFYFLRQPILVEMANAVLNVKGKYGIDKSKSITQLENEAINEVLDKYDPAKKYRKKYIKYNSEKDKAEQFGGLFKDGFLRSVLKNMDQTSESFAKQQIRIYYAWKALKPYADDLANLVKYSKIDTKKAGKSFIEQYLYEEGMKRMEDPKQNRFAPGSVTRFYELTFLRTKTNNTIPIARKPFETLLFRTTPWFRAQVDQVLDLLCKKKYASEQLTKDIVNGIEAQIKAGFFEEYCKNANLNVHDMFYGKNSIPQRLFRFKQNVLRGEPRLSHLLNDDGSIANDFVNFLIPNLSESDLNFIDKFQQIQADQVQANNLINYWGELLNDPNPEVQKLFADLAVYAFFTSGDNAVMNSFFQYLPNSFKEEIGYTDYIQEQLDLMASGKYIFDIDDFIRNSWRNDQIIPFINFWDNDSNERLQSITAKDSAIPQIIIGKTFTGKQALRPIGFMTVMDNVNIPIFQQFVKIADPYNKGTARIHMYQLIGYTEDIDTTNGSAKTVYSPVYGLISKKGVYERGHTIVEYGYAPESAFDFNNEIEWDYYGILTDPARIKGRTGNDASAINLINDIKPIDDMYFSLAFASIPHLPIISPMYEDNINDNFDESDYTEDEQNDETASTEDNSEDTESTQETKQPKKQRVFIATRKFTRKEVQEDPHTLYIFTDNTDRTSGGQMYDLNGWYFEKYGMGGYGSENNPTTAVIRGLPNAAPISTMRYFYKSHDNMTVNQAKWTDADIDLFKQVVGNELDQICRLWASGRFDKVVFPQGDGFLNGRISDITLARTPLLYNYLVSVRQHLEDFINNTEPADANLFDLAEKWSKKEGWSTGHFYKSVLPKIDDAWQIEFEVVEDQSVPVEKGYYATMKYSYGNDRRSDVTAETTIDAVKRGERTATTRYGRDGHLDHWKKFKAGDIVLLQGENTSVKVRITKPLTKLQLESDLVIHGENISSRGSTFAKLLTNIGNDVKVVYKGKTFRNAEHAYQSWKSGEFDEVAFNDNSFKPKGVKAVDKNKNYDIMVEIITAKLQQHPELIDGIDARGGNVYLALSTHEVIGGTFWESSGQDKFMQALRQAYNNVKAQTTEESGYTNHSGGAVGADTVWGEIGAEFGVKSNNYYTGERSSFNAPNGNVEISAEDFEEGRYKVAEAARATYGYQYDTMKDPRLIRNWAQVKYSDAIFAVGTIVKQGERLFPNQLNDTRIANKDAVTGGTGYAVEMAIRANKPVYVFDQNVGKWYSWDSETSSFVECKTPVLTKSFAGIGTRNINEAGKYAIRQVYENTFGKKQAENTQTVSTQNDEYADIIEKSLAICKQLGVKSEEVDSSELTDDQTISEVDFDNLRVMINSNWRNLLAEFANPKKELRQICIHESIHIATSWAIDNKENCSKEVQDAVSVLEAAYQVLLETEKDHYVELDGRIYPESNVYYGLTGVKEMAAEFSNKEFRKVLQRHSLLEKVIDAVTRILNELFNMDIIKSDRTLEDDVHDALSTIMDNFPGHSAYSGINNNGTSMNDESNFNDTEESKNVLQSQKTILSNKELVKLRPYVGTYPRIAVASEYSDPAFFAKKIIDMLDGKIIMRDKLGRPIQPSDIGALYIITKHDGLPMKKLLEYPIPKIIHFSITGLGGTQYEPGVMKYNDMLDRIESFIQQGLDPEDVTIRIDPIVPGVTVISDIDNIVKRASKMGIKNIRFSIMDWYSTTAKFMEDLGYDYNKYYDLTNNRRHAKVEIQKSIQEKMLAIGKKYGVNLYTCAEPLVAEGISKEACLSVNAVNKLLGTKLTEKDSGKQRQYCSCFGGKVDLLQYKDNCGSTCAYCYAHHNSDASVRYYNEDGTLHDTPFTRTLGNVQSSTNMKEVNYSFEFKSKVREFLHNNQAIIDERYYRSVLQELANEGITEESSKDQVEEAIREAFCNL